MDTLKRDEYFMQQALGWARRAADEDEVPVGAVVVAQDAIIAAGSNQPRSTSDPTAHAEVVALRAAAVVLQNYRLVDATLYVTVEPCMMCAGALVHARIRRLVFGAPEPKAGCIVSHPLLGEDWLNHQPQVTGGVCEAECAALMQAFFAARREHKAAEARQGHE